MTDTQIFPRVRILIASARSALTLRISLALRRVQEKSCADLGREDADRRQGALGTLYLSIRGAVLETEKGFGICRRKIHDFLVVSLQALWEGLEAWLSDSASMMLVKSAQ